MSCPQAAPPRRGGAIRVGRSLKQHHGYIGREKSLYYYAFWLTSCQPRLGPGHGPAGLALGNSKLLLPTGQTQAHGWPVGGTSRVLILMKFMGERKKNEQFPLSCPQAAPPRRLGGGAMGRLGLSIIMMATLEGNLKSHCITPFGLYPASHVSGHGRRPGGLGKLRVQAVTTRLFRVNADDRD